MKKAIFSITTFQGRHEKSYFSVSKNRFIRAPRKSEFFGFRKTLFQGAMKKRFFSVSKESIFRGATKKRFFKFQKNRSLMLH